jgi:hypothetical protein
MEKKLKTDDFDNLRQTNKIDMKYKFINIDTLDVQSWGGFISIIIWGALIYYCMYTVTER